MGFFSSANRQPTDVIRPISQDRIEDILDEQGWHYEVDEEGDLGGMWDGNSFYFLLTGSQNEVLTVLGYLRPHIPPEARDALRVFIEDWHRDHFWPKVTFTGDPDDGWLRLSAAVSVDHEHGATDAQLTQHILCGLGTAAQVFDSACETFDLQTPDSDDAE